MRRIIIALAALVLLGSMVFRLASNKKKIDQETSYHDSIADVSVNIRPVQTTVRHEEIVLTGIFRPSKESPVSAEIPGKIVRVAANEGDYLDRGQAIAELDRTQLELKLEADRAVSQHAATDLARYENLNRKGAATDATLQQMRLTETIDAIAVKNDEDQIARSTLTAPISGYLAVKHFEVGMVLSPGVPIGMISNTHVLKFTALVPEYQVVQMKPAQLVTVHADVFPGVGYPGTVTQIPVTGDDNHQYKIEVTVYNNSRNPLRGGMNGTMTLVAAEAVSGIFLPRESLVGATGSPQVYVVENNRAVLKKVSTGGVFGTEIRITGGLREGDRVVTTGMNNLRDSATIAVAGTR